MLNIFDEYALAWLNMGTFMIIPLLVTTIQLHTTIQDVTLVAQQEAQRLCEAASKAMLQESVEASNAVVQVVGKLLVFMIEALEAIILWVINAYKATYRCLLGLAVHGALSAVTKVTGPIQQATEGIVSGVENGKQAIERLFGGTASPANHVQLGNWTSALQDVQTKVTQWTTGDDPLDQMIRAPFDKVKQHVHDNVLSWKPSNIPSFGCDLTAISDSLDGAKSQLLVITRGLMGAFIAVAILAVGMNFLLIRYRRKQLDKQIRNLAFDLATGASKEGDMRGERKNIEKKLAQLIQVNRKPFLSKTQNVKGWWLDYLTHPLLLYCLVVGILGIALSYGAKAAIRHLLDGNNAGLGVYPVDGLNAWIAQSEADVNERTFGAIRQAALSANDTVSMVTEHISQFLKTTLGGTVFEEPATDVLNCLFMTKIRQLENGLTWIAQSTHVNLTRAGALDMREWNPGLEKQIEAKLDQDLAFYWALLGVWGLCLCIGLVLQFQKHLKKLRA
ncbi:hypothetical protein BJV82DRAFT_591295 [Fennellomyces sp. T-0311]|nr:hypothetical protein BJV82DRAFT_591295 [Fennellomyces sp. T-0311]